MYLWWFIFFHPMQVSPMTDRDLMHPGRLTVLPIIHNKAAPFAVAQKRHGVTGFLRNC